MNEIAEWGPDAIVYGGFHPAFKSYLHAARLQPLLLLGDAHDVLRDLPGASVDFAMTSPPYWGKREYTDGGIGLERTYSEFVRHLAEIFLELKRVLKPEGSFWLNIGDSYQNKCLVGIPWRVAFELIDHQGWILRNSVIWNKVKSGMDNTKDRLGNVHEIVFHFVKQPSYYYNADAIRAKPREAKIVNGAPVDLCRIPILATCPEEGVVLDPFCGTGTTLLAARNLGRKSVGIDLSRQYLEIAKERCATLL